MVLSLPSFVVVAVYMGPTFTVIHVAVIHERGHHDHISRDTKITFADVWEKQGTKQVLSVRGTLKASHLLFSQQDPG